MSSDLRELLEDAAHEPEWLPTSKETWAAGRSRRRVRRWAMVAGSAVVIAALSVGAMVLVDGDERGLETIAQPPDTTSPEGSPDDPTVQTLAQLGVASTVSLDDGATYESRFPRGTVVRAVDDGVSYPERLYGLADGTVVWQGTGGIYRLGPDDDGSTTLVPTRSDGAARSRLVGTGELDGEPVVLVEQSRAVSLEDDDGGVVSAFRLDGTQQTVLDFAAAWDYGIDAVSLRRGWLLYTESENVNKTTVLRAPDGTETLIEESFGEEHTLQAAALAEIDIAPGVAVVEHHVEFGDPDAPFGVGRLEIRSVNDASAGAPAWSIELPTDNVPKQLTVAGEWAYLTLLPDAHELLQINLHTSEIERFSSLGVVAVHAGLQPLPPDASPPAACAAAFGTRTDDAQGYVWLLCPDAATYEEGDQPTQFFGIHKLRLVTDPRASSGGVSQRVEATLEAIFAGPTPDEQALGYSGIIDASIDAIVDVTFEDGLITIELTQEGARAASIGTTARAIFQATIEAAIFDGFVDVDSLRLTVEGDCAAWSTHGEGMPSCLTYHRDGTATES